MKSNIYVLKKDFHLYFFSSTNAFVDKTFVRTQFELNLVLD